MNKQKFIRVLKDYHNIPAEDRDKLHDLAVNYPYSQIVHTLVAKANHDSETPIATQTLHYAAFYATDRNVLKDIIKSTPPIEEPVDEEVTQEEIIEESVSHSVETVESDIPEEKEKITVDPEAYDPPNNKIREAVLQDLENLKKSKAQYMEWIEQDEAFRKESIAKPADSTPDVDIPSTPAAPPVVETEQAPVQELTPARKGRKPKAEKSTKDKEKGKSKLAKEPAKKVGKKGKTKKIAHEEQKNIIEKFISKEPSISARPLKSSEAQPDLSAASTSFNEDLVSENLAQIFVNQGKKEKAIDIYKKLIWKFPQKKTYFASRIEELQN